MKRVALLLFLGGCLVPLASAQITFSGRFNADTPHLATNSNMRGGSTCRRKGAALPDAGGEMSTTSTKFSQKGYDPSGAPSPFRTAISGSARPFWTQAHRRSPRNSPFVTLKGGFVHFRLDQNRPSFSGF